MGLFHRNYWEALESYSSLTDGWQV